MRTLDGDLVRGRGESMRPAEEGLGDNKTTVQVELEDTQQRKT